MNSYEVLVFNTESPHVKWVATQNSDLPGGAILAGREANDRPLYVVKASVANQVLIGKMNPTHRGAYVPHNGREVVVTRYEVLVISSSESTAEIADTTTTTTTGEFSR